MVYYPRQVYLIIITAFCERFCFFGIRSVLVTYLTEELEYSHMDSVTTYHVANALSYGTPLLGAIVSDGSLGKYKTITIFASIYITGIFLLLLSSIRPLSLPQEVFTWLGLAPIAVGAGGVKTCIPAFGGDQFSQMIPQKYIDRFFYFYYLSVNIGITLSTITMPFLNEAKCLGQDKCYPAIYGTTMLVLCLGLVFFFFGTKMYAKVIPKINILLLWLKCIGTAIKERFKFKEKVDHWLDRAQPTYGNKLVGEVKETLRVIVVFLPLLFFWTLFEQIGSTWILQANYMNGITGPVLIHPGNMMAANSLFILIIIPILVYIIYPLCEKLNIPTTPLERIAAGGFITALAFFVAAFVSLFGIEPTLPVLPTGQKCQVRIYNPLDCTAVITARPYLNSKKIGPMGYEKIEVKNVKGTKLVKYQISGCNVTKSEGNNFNVTQEATIGYFISEYGLERFDENIKKDRKGRAKVRTLVSKPSDKLSLTYWKKEKDGEHSKTFKTNNYTYIYLKLEKDETYKLSISTSSRAQKQFDFYRGAYYVVLINLKNNNIKKIKVYEVTKRNRIHIFWQIPQYLLISIGEVLVSPTALEFAYTQSPKTMKSAMTSAWLLTIGLGNLVVIIIEKILMEAGKQSTKFFIYGALMIVHMILFVVVAIKYNYTYHIGEEDEDDEDDESF